MAPDIFYPGDLHKLFDSKVVVFMGDSNLRALYKDLVTLTLRQSLITKKDLKSKMENSYFGDRLIYHGKLHNGRDFREEREFICPPMKSTYAFFFITKVLYGYVEEVLARIKEQPPHVVVINSCLWDLTRWGPNQVNPYKRNIETVMRKLKCSLPKALIIWLTSAPMTGEVKGGFLVEQLDFLKLSLRFQVMEANLYAHQMASKIGIDVLDVHYNLRLEMQRRAEDGIHWEPAAVRHTTNSLLTHISLAWEVPLPHRFPLPPDAEQVIVNPAPRAGKKRKRRSRQALDPWVFHPAPLMANDMGLNIPNRYSPYFIPGEIQPFLPPNSSPWESMPRLDVENDPYMRTFAPYQQRRVTRDIYEFRSSSTVANPYQPESMGIINQLTFCPF